MRRMSQMGALKLVSVTVFLGLSLLTSELQGSPSEATLQTRPNDHRSAPSSHFVEEYAFSSNKCRRRSVLAPILSDSHDHASANFVKVPKDNKERGRLPNFPSETSPEIRIPRTEDHMAPNPLPIRIGSETTIRQRQRSLLGTSETIAVDESEILLEMKKTLQQGSKQLLASWNFSVKNNHCSWSGVTCNTAQEVVGLDLSLKQLEGTISPAVGNLSSLLSLNLSGNAFTGQIPDSLGLCTNLTNLNLSRNDLQGPLPINLGDLQQLEELSVSFNPNISGPIPPGLGRCKKLLVLDISWTNVSGSIPQSIGNLTQLTVLRIHSNSNLGGEIPPQLGSLIKLERLELHRNKLIGTIPSTLGNCTNLRYLRLSRNFLIGNIPTTLASLRLVRYVALSDNNLSSSIPLELGALSRLQKFYIANNQLSGFIPPSLANCTKLVEINLDGNSFISGGIPMDFGSRGSFRRLEKLELGNNNLSGIIPAALGNLTELLILDLSNNSLSGKIPQELGGLHSVTYISLDQNDLTGSIPPELGKLLDLEFLYLFKNHLTGPFPSELGNCSKLSILSLGDNNITGALPPELSRLSALEELHVQRNQLAGDIPWAALSNCTNLRQLVVMKQGFTGKMPDELGRWFPHLEVLDFSKNHLRGGIPPSIHNCTKLQLLRLYANNFSGELAMDISKFPHLNTLHVESNKFNGTLEKLQITCANGTKCNTLEYLNLSFNKLEGTLPDYPDEAFLDMLVLTMANNQLRGPIPSWVWNMKGLEVLDLHGNQFDGEIPEDFNGRLAAMKTNSSMRRSRLRGLPSDPKITSEQTLISVKRTTIETQYILRGSITLDLSHNSLRGQIPPQVGTLLGLKRLNLSSNNFTGPIDNNLGALGDLEDFDLSVNNLSGEIPAFMSGKSMDATQVGFLNISYNNLSGFISSTRYPVESYLPGNEGLCNPDGVILRECSTASSNDSNGSNATVSDSGDDSTDFSDIFSIVAFEIGTAVGALIVGSALLFCTRLRHSFFKLPERTYTRVYGLYTDRIRGSKR